MAIGSTIHVSSSGTAKVRKSRTPVHAAIRESINNATEYLRGNSKDECADLFKKYNSCLMVGTSAILLKSITTDNTKQKALKDRGIDTMLEEAKQASSDSDAEHLRR